MRQKRKRENQTKRLAADQPGYRKRCRREPQIKKTNICFLNGRTWTPKSEQTTTPDKEEMGTAL